MQGLNAHKGAHMDAGPGNDFNLSMVSVPSIYFAIYVVVEVHVSFHYISVEVSVLV